MSEESRTTPRDNLPFHIYPSSSSRSNHRPPSIHSIPLLPPVNHESNSTITDLEENPDRRKKKLSGKEATKVLPDEEIDHTSDHRRYLDNYPRHALATATIVGEWEENIDVGRKENRKPPLPTAIEAFNREGKAESERTTMPDDNRVDESTPDEVTLAVDVVRDAVSEGEPRLDNCSIKEELTVRSITRNKSSARISDELRYKSSSSGISDKVWDLSSASAPEDVPAPERTSSAAHLRTTTAHNSPILNTTLSYTEPPEMGGSSVVLRHFKPTFVKQENGSPFNNPASSLRASSPYRSTDGSLIPEGVMMFNYSDSQSPVDHESQGIFNSSYRSGGGARNKDDVLLNAEYAPGGPFACSLCTEVFAMWEELEAHCLVEHTRNPCRFCTKTFAQKANRDRHVCLHTGDKPYGCPDCEERFSRGDKLKMHRSRAHGVQYPMYTSRHRGEKSGSRRDDRPTSQQTSMMNFGLSDSTRDEGSLYRSIFHMEDPGDPYRSQWGIPARSREEGEAGARYSPRTSIRDMYYYQLNRTSDHDEREQTPENFQIRSHVDDWPTMTSSSSQLRLLDPKIEVMDDATI